MLHNIGIIYNWSKYGNIIAVVRGRGPGRMAGGTTGHPPTHLQTTGDDEIRRNGTRLDKVAGTDSDPHPTGCNNNSSGS